MRAHFAVHDDAAFQADALDVERPLAVPRWSCTLVEPQVRAMLDRLGATTADLETPEALEGRLARAAMGAEASRTLNELRETIAMLPDALGAESEALGIGAAVVGGAQSLQHRLDRLERRFVAAIKRREAAQMRDVATLRAALRPRGARQERVLNLLPLLARHGCDLLSEMCGAAGPHAAFLVEPGRDAHTSGAPA